MRAVIVALVAAVVLAGCGGSDESSDVKPLDTASPSDSLSSGDAKNVTRPKDVKSEAGAIAFSEFAVRTIFATTGGADIENFLTITSPSCEGCLRLAKQVGEAPDSVQRFDGPIKISNPSIAERNGDEIVVEQAVDLPKGQKIDTSDKSALDTFDPITYTFRMLLTWSSDTWILSNYAADKS